LWSASDLGLFNFAPWRAAEALDYQRPTWDNYPTMTGRRTAMPATDILRAMIVNSKTPLLRLEKETGVDRASLRRFVRGETSLRLDMADKLIVYFGLGLVPRRKRKGMQTA
jgi:hypothetical protein